MQVFELEIFPAQLDCRHQWSLNCRDPIATGSPKCEVKLQAQICPEFKWRPDDKTQTANGWDDFLLEGTQHLCNGSG